MSDGPTPCPRSPDEPSEHTAAVQPSESVLSYWVRSIWNRVTRTGVIQIAALALSIGSFLTTMEGFHTFLSPKSSTPVLEASAPSDETSIERFANVLASFLGDGESETDLRRAPFRTTVLTLTFTTGVQLLLYAISFQIGQGIVRSATGSSGLSRGTRLIRTILHLLMIAVASYGTWAYAAPGDVLASASAGIGAAILGLIIRYVLFFDRGAVVGFFLAVAYTVVLSLSSLFSFDAIYRYILTEEEAKKEADAVLIEEQPLLIVEIGSVLSQQRASAWEQLIFSDAFTDVEQHRENLKHEIRNARSELRTGLNEQIDAIKGEGESLLAEIKAKDNQLERINDQISTIIVESNRLAARESESAAELKLQESLLENELLRRGQPEDLEEQIREAKQRMQNEAGGFQGANAGEGPKFRVAQRDFNRFTAELQILRGEISPLKEKIIALVGEVDNLTLERDAQRQDLTRLEAEKAELEKARNGLAAKKRTRDTRSDELTGDDPVNKWIRVLDDASRKFVNGQEADSVQDFKNSCSRAQELLLANSVFSGTDLTGACWRPELDARLAEIKQLESATLQFAIDCGPTAKGPEELGLGTVFTSAPLEKARRCFEIANIRGVEAVKISRQFTELEVEYGGDPNLRRAISNFARGEKFAIGAFTLAVAIDLLILICGVIAGLLALQYNPGRLDRLSEEEQFNLIAASLAQSGSGSPGLSENARFIRDLLKSTDNPTMFEIRESDVSEPEDRQRLSRFLTAVRPIGSMVVASDKSTIHRVPVRVLVILSSLGSL